MPDFDIIKECNPSKTFRVQSVLSQFDLQQNKVSDHFKGSIDIEDKEWNIGVIYGGSGSGKSTIAKQLFPDYYFKGYEYKSESILDDMPKEISTKEVFKTFNSVGFSSPPNWLKPYSVLSNGEKMRVDLARSILENKDVIVFDEFTSVVNREVAKVGSYAISKSIKRANKKFIAVSCHDDILEWLEPDWTFNTNTMEFQYNRGLLRRPEINIEIRRCNKSMWKYFKKYHYLNHAIHTSSHCYVGFTNNIPVVFSALMNLPHGRVKNFKRLHRSVVIPDYQGCGIGHTFINEICSIYKKQGFRVITTTSTPALVYSRNKDPKWKLKKAGRSLNNSERMIKTTANNRFTTSWEYYG